MGAGCRDWATRSPGRGRPCALVPPSHAPVGNRRGHHDAGRLGPGQIPRSAPTDLHPSHLQHPPPRTHRHSGRGEASVLCCRTDAAGIAQTSDDRQIASAAVQSIAWAMHASYPPLRTPHGRILMIERLTLPDLFSPPGYAHVAVAAGQRIVTTAGAVPLDADGQLVGPHDLAAQTRQTIDNLIAALAAVGQPGNMC